MAITFSQFLAGKEFYIGAQREISGYAKIEKGIPTTIHFSDETIVEVQRIVAGSVAFSFTRCGIDFWHTLHIDNCFLC